MNDVRRTSSGRIAAAIDGDRDALRDVWHAHRGWAAAIVLAHKPRESDLEDLMQVVALQLVTNIAELREPEAFKPWLRQVAANVARAAGRKTTRRRRHTPAIARTTAGANQDRADADSPGRVEASDEADRVMGLARSLPEAYREPLLMRCVRGMSYRQIGAVLDLPETTIETRIARGRRMLRELASADAQQNHQTETTETRADARTT